MAAQLARDLIAGRALPSVATADVLHIGIATAIGSDFYPARVAERNTMVVMEEILVKVPARQVPARLRNALAAEARRRNVTQSTIVREALERCLLERPDADRNPSCADLVRDLVGSVKSGRRDLATNQALLQSAVEADFGRGRKRRR